MKIILFILFSLFTFNSFGQKNPQIKVLTYNILHGETMAGDFDLDKIAKVIQESGAHIVALQEVDYKTNRAHKKDLTMELAYRCQMQAVFAKAMEYDDGEYGEAILSKWSFYQTNNHALPFSGGNEPRAALETKFILESGDTIVFIGTHLDHLASDHDRVLQANQLLNLFKNRDIPCILAGDLNDVPESESIQILKSYWQLSDQKDVADPTYPAINPRKKIDYIMLAPADRWKVLDTQTICDTIASDHCGYLVTLILLPKQ